MRVITCEQVSNGHPDKICDQVADAIVTDCLHYDNRSRVAIECLVKDDKLVIAGELSSIKKPNYYGLVGEVLDRIGRDKLDYDDGLELEILVKEQSGDIAMGVNTGGAGDQGMMYGYATDETDEFLPVPYILATRFLERLRDDGDCRFKADAKAQVSFDYEKNRITTFLCSVQHKAEYEPKSFAPYLEEIMEDVAADYGFQPDFRRLVNPTGRFVKGGSFADCGVTGRKIACDTYGGVGRIGGGALSGKDPTKVDRSGAYAAREIAKRIVRNGWADRCEVQIAYAIGVAEPVSVYVDSFGTEHVKREDLEEYVKAFDLTPKGIIKRLRLADVDYNQVSAYGHFTNGNAPWELR